MDFNKSKKNNIDQSNNNKTPLILDGEFFKIKEINLESVKVSAVCVLCKNIYNGSLSSTANFLKHLRAKHIGKLIFNTRYLILIVFRIIYFIKIIRLLFVDIFI